MKGLAILKQYYSYDQDDNFKLLISKDHLQQMLDDVTLITLLREIENIEHHDHDKVLQTLYLVCRLAKIDNARIRGLFPHQKLPEEKVICSTITLDQQLHRLVHNIIVKYLNFLLKDDRSSHDHSALQMELSILTEHLSEIKDSFYSKDKHISKSCDSVYWLAEEELFQLWLRIDKQLPQINTMQPQFFEEFYRLYTLFCTFRRKIPSLRHKQLKSVSITPEANKRIELRLHEIREKQQEADLVQINVRGLNRLVSNEIDFDDL